MRSRSAVFSLSLLIALVAGVTHAQVRDHQGTDFWIAFPLRQEFFPPNEELSITIVGETAASGTVEVPATGRTEATTIPFSITAGGATTIQLPLSLQLDVGVIERKGIHVTATSEVSVVGLNREDANGDAFLALPTDALGLEYRIITWNGGGTVVAVLAVEDDTSVTIDPPGEAPQTVVLQRGEAFQIGDGSKDADLSGTRITSSKPAAAYGAHVAALVVRPFLNHVVEQLWPIDSWGTEYAAAPLFKVSAPRVTDVYRIVAAHDDTDFVVPNVTVDAGTTITLDTGEAFAVSADKPFGFAQFSAGEFGSLPPLGDPFMILVPHTGQFLRRYAVVNLDRPHFDAHFINIVIPSDSASSFRIDGEEVTPRFGGNIAGTSLAWKQFVVEPGPHVLSAAVPFGASVYGYGVTDGYGYPAGVLLAGDPVSDLVTTISPAAASMESGSSFALTAIVRNDGPHQAGAVEAKITVVSGLTIEACNAGALSCSGIGTSTVTVQAGTLRVGDTATIDVTIGAGCQLADGTSLSVTATASSESSDPTTGNNTATALLVVLNPPPVLACMADVATTNTAGLCSALVDPGLPSTSDNCPGVTVSGSRSDGMPLAAPWPVGQTSILWTAVDTGGAMTTCTQKVTVSDDEPPSVEVSGPNRAVLWPPNHKMVDVLIGYTATDNCGGEAAVNCALSVASNEPENGLGDGDKAPDWEIVNAKQVRLRAERSGLGNDRVYTITITCTDAHGNRSVRQTTVRVPHSR